MPRRRPDSLTPIEFQILSAAAVFAAGGEAEFHGFAAAKVIQEAGDARRLTATGTLYRALHRLQGFGYLASRWEEPALAIEGGRPLRRLYRLTAAGEAARVRAAPETPRAALHGQPEAQTS